MLAAFEQGNHPVAAERHGDQGQQQGQAGHQGEASCQGQFRLGAEPCSQDRARTFGEQEQVIGAGQFDAHPRGN